MRLRPYDLDVRKHDHVPELPKSWDPAEHESRLYQGWVEAGYFTADATSDRPPYSIVIPPPNVNGSLHMGHAFEHVLMDALSRRRRMQGFEVLWLPGMDHAAIAMQTMVEEKLAAEGLTRDDLGREVFVARVWAEKAEIGFGIAEQMRRLGDGVDWSRERFTLDDALSRAVRTVFKQLYDDGLVYRAERLVNWSPALRTAVSDIEVSYAEVQGELVSFRYGSMHDERPHILVATTRIETMLGDTAIAVHPDDDRYRGLVGTWFDHPLVNRRVPVIADEHVDPGFGSGAVKITPAHDPNDFVIGQRHGLDMPTVMDERARIAGTGTRFDGMDRFEARTEVLEALAAQGRVTRVVRPYVHSVGHSERSGEPIEPRLSMQWWVKVESLAKAAGDAVRGRATRIHPASMEPRWFGWVDDMHDWCISRQLWWGHRIPIWYGPEGNVVCLGPNEEVPPGYVQENDVLDTWFSSALWPFSTMGWPERSADLEKFYPTSVLVTGYDLLFFWVARMTMFGTYVGAGLGPGKGVPFIDVCLHGLVRDEHGRKMSKSKGNGIDPLDWVERFGADALRFALARDAMPGSDISVSEEQAQSSRNFATKLFNATKFALKNGARVGELPDAPSLTAADRWILHRFDEVLAEVDAGLEAFQFSRSCMALYHFAWDDLCDWYLEMSKVQLAADDAERRATTRLVLGAVLDPLLRSLSPVMPFVTEVLWKSLTGGESVVVAPWPRPRGVLGDDAAGEIKDLRRLVTEVRRFRSDQGLSPRQLVACELDGLDAAGLGESVAYLYSLAQLERAGNDFAATASIAVRLTATTVTVRIDTSGTIDLAAERNRVAKALAAAEKERETTTARLDNEQFRQRAPDQVVATMRDRHRLAIEEVQRLRAELTCLDDQ